MNAAEMALAVRFRWDCALAMRRKLYYDLSWELPNAPWARRRRPPPCFGNAREVHRNVAFEFKRRSLHIGPSGD